MTARTDRSRAAALAAVALAALPIAVAGVRAAAGRWVPQGDDAYFTVRAMDVATEHHPLLGAWSSGSTDIERDVNNLGPLQLDLLAPFVKVAPMGGTALGVAAIHVVAVATIAWLIRRIGGWRSVAPAMVAVALTTWVMGSEMLITPRQHQFLLLPYLLALVAAWAAAAGDRWALVPFVVAGSLVTQTHLSYPILIAALAIPAVGGQIVAARRSGMGRYRRPWSAAALVGGALWAQTLIDQFFGRGNVGDVLQSPGETQSPGFGDALRIVADVIIGARAYSRPGFATYDPDAGLASDVQVAALLGLGLVLMAGIIAAFSRGHRTAAAGLVVGLTALVAAILDSSQLPDTQFGLTASNYRWLWPTAAFLVLGGLVALERMEGSNHRRVVGATSLVAIVVLVALNVPESFQVPAAPLYEERLATTAEITTELYAADLSPIDGLVVIDQSRMYFGHPFAYPVAVVLNDRGLDFRLEGDMQDRRFGEDRESDGTEKHRLVLVRGDDARAVRSAPKVVAYANGTDPVALFLESAS